MVKSTALAQGLADSIPSADRWKTGGFAVITAHQDGYCAKPRPPRNPGGPCSAAIGD